MTWLQFHAQSEQLATEAELATGRNETARARELYQRAAEAEYAALLALGPSKIRTLGITAVSAASLWFKAADLDRSERVACLLLSRDDLPDFAAVQLRGLVQSIWTEQSKQKSDLPFLPGQVFFSVKGGEVVTGGAPLDLIVQKVQTIQSIFYRSLEESQQLPLRTRGAPPREVQDACRPWLFQEPPGSYQFSVAIQGPAQGDFFADRVDPVVVAERFLAILKATVSEDPVHLESLVPDIGYRTAFLKLARNLAPTGTTFDQMEIRSVGDDKPLLLRPVDRKAISTNIRHGQARIVRDPELKEFVLKGVLRAVDLDKDWIEVSDDGASHHITGVVEALDDVIGPMMNRKVIVRAVRDGRNTFIFEDIELDE